MLTEIYQELLTRLSRSRIPAYLADCVPEGAEFPYITAKIDVPLTPGAEGSLTATLWYSGANANSKRISGMGSLLPNRGAWLATTAGTLTLLPDSPMACVQDGSLLGMQGRWKLRFYPSV